MYLPLRLLLLLFFCFSFQILFSQIIDEEENVAASTTSATADVNIIHGGTSGATNGLSLTNTLVDRYWTLWVDDEIPDTDLWFFFQGSARAAIDDDGSYQQLSDRRLKENIVDMSSVLEKVMMSQPRKFKFKRDSSNQEHIGFIAQELITIFPEVVGEGNDSDKFYMVDYASLTSVAFKAIQEQQEIIKALEARIEKLEQK